MTTDSIDYRQMTQEALTGVVRRCLEIAADGLPGEHHFYIAFATGVPGVGIPDELRNQYPDQMTIVLNQGYKDLDVLDDRFVVTLRFNGIPQRVTVPYNAMISFYDPSVQFMLPFEPTLDAPVDADQDAEDDGRPRRPPVRAVLAAADRLAAAKEAVERQQEAEAAGDEAADEGDQVAANRVASDDDGSESASQGAEIVSFDAFRRR